MLMIGVPVGFAIGGATMISMFYCSDLNMVVNAQYCYSGIFSFTVMAITFFMLAGSVISTGGIAKRIVEFASALIDFVTGALGCVSMLACMFFGALSGSGMAGMDSVNRIQTRRVMKRFYLCGDGTSDSSGGLGLVASRVLVCAAHEANMILRLIAGEREP